MRGDWKDQRLNEQYQQTIMRQVEQQRLIRSDQLSIVHSRDPVLPGWFSRLLHSRQRNPYKPAPVLKSQNLRTVK